MRIAFLSIVLILLGFSETACVCKSIEEQSIPPPIAPQPALQPEVELPDLSVADFSLIPDAPHTGQKVIIVASIINEGIAEARDFIVSAFIDNKRIGSQIVDQLAPGSQVEVQVRVSGLPPGEHRIKVITDAENWIREGDEVNNEIGRSLMVREEELPDLIIEEIIITPENPAPGEPARFSAVVRNIGRGPAERVDVALYAENEQAARGTDTAYADEVIHLAPGTGANPAFRDPGAALGPPDFSENPPRGFFDPGTGGSITLAFINNDVVDGLGNDLRIWGHPGQGRSFQIEVSDGGDLYRSFGLFHEAADIDLQSVGLKMARFVRITIAGSRIQESRIPQSAGIDAVQALHCLQKEKEPLEYLQTLMVLRPGQQEMITAVWRLTSPGEYILIAEVDPLDSERESDEANNRIERLARAGFPE